MAEATPLEFAPPDEVVAVDPEWLLATVPAGKINKRIFIDFACELVAGRVAQAEVLRRAGIELHASEPFEDVAWHDYFRVAVVVAELLQGRERIGAGLREIGRCFYPRLLSTIVGRMLLGRTMGEAIRRAAEAWAQFNDVGRIHVEFRGEREFYYHFEQFPTMLAETIAIGIFEGLFRHHHMPVDLQIARIEPMHSIVRMRW
jgi:hypothetical protein